jgi:hypothetical protein
MTAFDLLRSDAEYGWKDMTDSLAGVTEGQAWTMLPNGGSDYLHTDGSIFGIAMHTACVKWMYGSICFRNTELRWSELADQVAAFEPSWDTAMDFLHRGHAYWMESWANLRDLEENRPTNWKSGEKSAWKIIQIMNQHDSYHAGQIAMLRHAVGETNEKPTSVAADIREHCRDSHAW